MDALVLAGGRLPSEFARRAGQETKALLQWGGRSLLAIALQALREAPGIGRIVVIGGEAVRRETDARLYDDFIAEGTSGPDNIFLGLEALADRPQTLVSSCDLPFLNGVVIQGLLERTPPDAGVAYPYFFRQEVEAMFPGRRKTFVRCADGTLTGGNVMALAPGPLLARRRQIAGVFEGRKNPLRLLRLFGVGLLLKGLTGRLRVADLERRASALLACRCHGLSGCSPALAFDVDHWEDWQYVLDGRAGPHADPSGE